VVHGSPHRTVCAIPSSKSGTLVSCESFLELDFCYLLEVDPSVVIYEDQPETIEYECDGKIRRYTADFRVIRRRPDGGEFTEMVEVKPAVFIIDDKPKWKALRDAFRKRGLRFRMATDVTIRRGHLVQNAKLLARYVGFRLGDEMTFRIGETLILAKPRTLGEMAAGLGLKKDWCVTLYAAIGAGLFTVSLDQPLGPSSEIRYERGA
jgi:hypothetical protein